MSILLVSMYKYIEERQNQTQNAIIFQAAYDGARQPLFALTKVIPS